MNPEKILDNILSELQKENSSISGAVRAYNKSLEVLKEALLSEYERGCTDTANKIKEYEAEKQRTQN
ncbi:hypothetical protein RG089_000605 [Elizabethkingia anophelis]|nr:hypothetical protein [Elizabethkingia anophelis]ELB1892036.1 hypothetical protein [Elizabethkingia anophelis]